VTVGEVVKDTVFNPGVAARDREGGVGIGVDSTGDATGATIVKLLDA